MENIRGMYCVGREARISDIPHPAVVYLRVVSYARLAADRVHDPRLLDEHEAVYGTETPKSVAVGIGTWIRKQLEDFQPTYQIAVPAPGKTLLPRITELLHPGLFRERFGPTIFHQYDVSRYYDPATADFTTEGRALVPEDYDSLFSFLRVARANGIVEGKGNIRKGHGDEDLIEVHYQVARPFRLFAISTAFFSLLVGTCVGLGAAEFLGSATFAQLTFVTLFSTAVFLIVLRASRKRRIDLIESFHFAFQDAVKTAVTERGKLSQH